MCIHATWIRRLARIVPKRTVICRCDLQYTVFFWFWHKTAGVGPFVLRLRIPVSEAYQGGSVSKPGRHSLTGYGAVNHGRIYIGKWLITWAKSFKTSSNTLIVLGCSNGSNIRVVFVWMGNLRHGATRLRYGIEDILFNQSQCAKSLFNQSECLDTVTALVTARYRHRTARGTNPRTVTTSHSYENWRLCCASINDRFCKVLFTGSWNKVSILYILFYITKKNLLAQQYSVTGYSNVESVCTDL